MPHTSIATGASIGTSRLKARSSRSAKPSRRTSSVTKQASSGSRRSAIDRCAQAREIAVAGRHIGPIRRTAIVAELLQRADQRIERGAACRDAREIGLAEIVARLLDETP